MCLIQICTLQYHIYSVQSTDDIFQYAYRNDFILKSTVKCTSVFNIYYLIQMLVDQSLVDDPYFANKERDSDNLRNCSKSQISSVQLLSCVWWFVMNCSMLGFPVHHQLLELAQIHVHQVSDTIQPSYPLLSPSLPTFKLSQHQGLFQWVFSSHRVTKVLEFQLQHQSFQWIFRTDFL